MEFNKDNWFMQEAELYHFWKYVSQKNEPVFLNGHLLRVISPGELNLHRGPDFRSARFELDGIVYQGDVEFHQNTNDWYAHGHHKDKACANVLLHLVGKSSSSGLKPVENYFSEHCIPTFQVPESVIKAVANSPERICRTMHFTDNVLLNCIQNLATERLHLKIQRNLHAMQNESIPEIFYRLFFHALGYTGNEQAYESLADSIPSHITDSLRKEPILLYSLYVGKAGLMPTKPDDHFSRLIYKNYETFKARIPMIKNKTVDWQLAGLRPGSHPHFRLAGWIKLLRQSTISEIIDRIINIFVERFSYPVLYKQIIEILSVPVTGYWKSHSRMGKLSGHNYTIFFSRNRINECIVNVIIPLLAAQAIRSGSDGFKQYIEDFSTNIPCSQ